jgi:hypothetical protein
MLKILEGNSWSRPRFFYIAEVKKGALIHGTNFNELEKQSFVIHNRVSIVGTIAGADRFNSI